MTWRRGRKAATDYRAHRNDQNPPDFDFTSTLYLLLGQHLLGLCTDCSVAPDCLHPLSSAPWVQGHFPTMHPRLSVSKASSDKRYSFLLAKERWEKWTVYSGFFFFPADCGGTLVLVSQDGIQRPPLHFPPGGHLLAFLSCLETGLLPRGQLEPPLWSQKGKVRLLWHLSVVD